MSKGKKTQRGTKLAKLTYVALVWDLMGDYATRLPEVLKSTEWQQKVREALQKQADELKQKHDKGEKVTTEDALKIVKTIGKSAAKETLERVKKDPAYKELTYRLTKLKEAFDKTPVGVFVDENKGKLILLAAGIAVGGAIAMYKTRSGDTVAGLASLIAENVIPTIELGAIKFDVKEITFKPSEQHVSLGVGATLDWKGVTGKFELTVESKEGKTVLKNGKAALMVPLARNLSLGVSGSIAPPKKKGELGLAIFKEYGNKQRLKLGLTYSDQIEERFGGQRDQRLMLGVGITFHGP